MLVGDLRGKWRECDPYLTSEMISSVPENSGDIKTSTQVLEQSFYSISIWLSFFVVSRPHPTPP